MSARPIPACWAALRRTLALIKAGAGTQILAGSNTYSGGTTVSAGILDYQITSAQPSSGTTTVSNGAVLALGIGAAAGYYNSGNIDSLFANTLGNVSMASSTGVGIDTTAGNFTYNTSNSSTGR